MWYCVFSSFIFVTNAIMSYMASQHVIAGMFLVVVVLSVIYHSIRRMGDTIYFTKNISIDNRIATPFVRWVDICVSVSAFVYLFIIYTHKQSNIKWTTRVYFVNGLIFTLLGYIAVIYFYDIFQHKYCFHPNKHIGEQWHSTLHLAASVAHHLTV